MPNGILLKNLKGFTLSEVLITMAVLAIFMAVTVPMFTLQKTFFGGDRDAYNCVVKDAANLTKPSCIAAVDKCKRNKNNTCTTLQYLALAYTDPAYTVLGKACTDGGEQACSILINRCIANSANCNVDTKNYFQVDLTTVEASDKTYDVNHFLTMKATDNTAGKETMYNLLKEKIALGISNIANSIITACSVDSSNMACTLLSHKVYHFEADDEPDFIEQSSEFGTIFKSSKAQLVSTASANADFASAYCWGYNITGQLGNGFVGSGTEKNIPTAVKDPNGNLPGLNFSKISSDGAYTCALTSSGAAYCWGYNGYGQLGIGSNSLRNVPTAVVKPDGSLPGLTFSQISSKGSNTCWLEKTTGYAYCSGFNPQGQVGNNTPGASPTFDRYVPTAVVKPDGSLPGLTFSQIAKGGFQTCGIEAATDKAYCWGYNFKGVLGDGTLTDRYVPTAVKDPNGNLPGLSFSKIYTGDNNTCALTGSGIAYCWGYGWAGAIGDNTTGDSYKPVQVKSPSGTLPGLNFSQLSAGTNYNCGIEIGTDKAYCWGYNDYGQLGDNSTTQRNVPTAVKDPNGNLPGLSFSQIAAGSATTCGIEKTTGAAYCWGRNTYGQLGINTSGSPATDKKLPTAVSGGLVFSQLDTDAYNTCGLVPASVYYITTSDTNNIINIKSKVIKATITQTTPANTSIKYLVSFDGRATWQMYNGASWSVVNTSSGLISAASDGSTSTQIQNGLNNYTLPSGSNSVDIAAFLSTTNPASATPLLDKIDIWYY